MAHELEPRRLRQKFARLESQMSSLPTDLRTWLGSMKNWQWTQSYDEGFRFRQITINLVETVNSVLRRTRHLPISAIFSTTFYRLATLMPRMRLRQAKQIEAGHVLQRTLRIWWNEFPVIPDVSNWEVPLPAFEMVPNHSLRRHPTGRPQSTRIQNDMDVREMGEPKMRLVCRASGHNRSTNPHRVYISGQSSRNARL
ncbi:hypothetical protein GOBAR_DD06607 [Gossypium barbadense]|nr:hypothetical protein GOBAR_DD06607 [Gossypium barbadense]